jgi:hypothetical protein
MENQDNGNNDPKPDSCMKIPGQFPAKDFYIEIGEQPAKSIDEQTKNDLPTRDVYVLEVKVQKRMEIEAHDAASRKHQIYAGMERQKRDNIKAPEYSRIDLIFQSFSLDTRNCPLR